MKITLMHVQSTRANRCARLGLAIWILTTAGLALAQRNTAAIFGTVTDASGGVIPGAVVTVNKDDTGETRTTPTDNLGNFFVPDLAPGRYTLTVSAQGFKQFVRKDLTLNVDQRPQINVTLQVGDTAESVTVSEAAPLVDATHANIGGVVDNTYTEQLPLNGRQFLQLAFLLPGTSPNAGGQTSARGGGPRNIGLQTGGNRATNNSYLIDGADSFGFRFKNTSLRPSVASIQEFKVLESPYDAQYGVASGVQVTVITKSGTNDFHGELFEFLRNDKLDARNFFDVTKPAFRQNQFGVALGGPIRRNRTFFFASYEGFRSRRGLSIGAQVPTPAELSGDFSSDPRSVIDPLTRQPFPNNIIPQNRISPVARKFVPFYPAPNTALRAPNFINSASDAIDDDQYTVRIDHTISDKWKVFGRYSYADVDRFTPGAIPLFGTLGLMTVQNVVLGSSFIFGPRTVLDARIGYNREDAVNVSEQVGKMKSADFGIAGLHVSPDVDGVPNVTVLGFATLGDALNSPEGRIENFEQFIVNLTRTQGRHTIRVGGNAWPVQLNGVHLAGIDRGTFSFTNIWSAASTGLPDFLLGLPQTAQRQLGRIREDARTVLYNVYGSDDIRVSPRLTFSVGLRYELRLSFVDKSNRLGSFIPEGEGRFIAAGDPNNGFTGRMNRSLYRTPKKNFAPRASLAYDLSGRGRTILRAGYGIFYNLEIFNSQYFNALNPPFVVFQAFNANPATGLVLPIADPFSAGPAAGGQPGGQFVSSWFRQGYMQQWSLGIQQELTSDLGLEVGYVANKGTALDGVRRLNQGALPGTPNAAYIRPFPAFGLFTVADSFGDSNYHSLQSRITRRFSRGLTFIGAYTYGHAIDNSPGEGNGSGNNFFVMDNNNLRRERGDADFDVRHRGTFTAVYDLPFGSGRRFLSGANGFSKKVLEGWQVAGIYQVQSGFPLTVSQSGNRSGTFASNERADRLCNGNLPGERRVRERWFDTSCFAPSPLGFFGNAARGIIRRPGQNNLDFSVLKQTRLTESSQLEFRAEFFNLPNHTQFSMTTGLGANASVPLTFGVITEAQDPRIIQFGLRLVF
jgi:hypothetical protein